MLSLSPFVPSRIFPPIEECDEDGLLAIGGKLTPEWLLDAYVHGIFPWPINEEQPVLWWSPDPRAVIDWEQVHFSRRLLRTCRSGRFRVTFNTDFSQVIRLCAQTHTQNGGTWVTSDIIKAYTEFHKRGYAKSVEVWHEAKLVGGIYGVAIRGFFAAESMFHTETDASKVALVSLLNHLRERDILLVDIQMVTSHTQQFGGVEITRDKYLRQLNRALQKNTTFLAGD